MRNIHATVGIDETVDSATSMTSYYTIKHGKGVVQLGFGTGIFAGEGGNLSKEGWCM